MLSEIILESWRTLSRYIKDIQPAADNFVSSLIDVGVDEGTFADIKGEDEFLDNALDLYNVAGETNDELAEEEIED